MSTCVVQERDAVLAIVASVLHLGNISFTHGDMDNAMLLDERSEDAMYIVAELMQVSSYITIPLHPADHTLWLSVYLCVTASVELTLNP